MQLPLLVMTMVLFAPPPSQYEIPDRMQIIELVLAKNTTRMFNTKALSNTEIIQVKMYLKMPKNAQLLLHYLFLSKKT